MTNLKKIVEIKPHDVQPRNEKPPRRKSSTVSA